MNKSVSFAGRLHSFKYAFAGIWTMLKSQQNAWIHAFATLIVLAAGFLLDVSTSEWCWLVLAILAVWMAEAFNTAIEFLANVVSPEFHPLVKKAKDVSAGAVLISAMGAMVIGFLILAPHILKLIT